MATPPRMIDIHQHWIPRAHHRRLDSFMRPGEYVLRRGADTRSSLMRNGQSMMNMDEACISDPDAHLADMDANGIDAAVFQMAIWLEYLDLDAAREANDEMAEVQRTSGGRLVGLAHVPPLADGAERELERAIRDLDLRGVNLTTHWRGVYLDEPPFRPLLRKAEELDVPVVVHASGTSGPCAFLDADGSQFGRVVDMTMIVTKLLKSDLLEELPSLRFVMPQLGGAFWAVQRRLAIEEPHSALGSRRHLLDRLWFDTAPGVWASQDLTLAVANLGADRLLFGSDYPSTRNFMQRAADALRGATISDAERGPIYSGNAKKLFRM